MLSLDITSESAQEALGTSLASVLPKNCVVYLHGDLGSGKTTLVRGILRGFNYLNAVKSPTYTLIEPYYLDHVTLLHLDLYRIQNAIELEYLGLADFNQLTAIWLIEWPERGANRLPVADVAIEITHQPWGRGLVFNPHTAIGITIVTAISNCIGLNSWT